MRQTLFLIICIACFSALAAALPIIVAPGRGGAGGANTGGVAAGRAATSGAATSGATTGGAATDDVTTAIAAVPTISPNTFNRLRAHSAIEQLDERAAPATAVLPDDNVLSSATFVPRDHVFPHADAPLSVKTADGGWTILTLFGSKYAQCFRRSAAASYATVKGLPASYTLHLAIDITVAVESELTFKISSCSLLTFIFNCRCAGDNRKICFDAGGGSPRYASLYALITLIMFCF